MDSASKSVYNYFVIHIMFFSFFYFMFLYFTSVVKRMFGGDRKEKLRRCIRNFSNH